MSKHKKQHYVPACYLKAWRDPGAPQNHTPYVWLFDRDGSNARKRAPENIFHEKDMYTIERADGARDLVLEHGLNQLETEFARLRNKKLNSLRPLEEDDRVLLCAFTAAAQARTPASREHHRQQWERPFRMMEEMTEKLRTATSEEKRRMAAHVPPSSDGKGLTYEQVKEMHERPMQSLLASIVQVTTPLLCKLDMAILVTDDEVGFITSDHPCVWFDPEGYKRPPLFRGPALMYESIEITLPLSPAQCLFLNRKGLAGYIGVKKGIVDELNRRTRFECDKYFVVKRTATHAHWFDPGVEPDDSWEKLHANREDLDR